MEFTRSPPNRARLLDRETHRRVVDAALGLDRDGDLIRTGLGVGRELEGYRARPRPGLPLDAQGRITDQPSPRADLPPLRHGDLSGRIGGQEGVLYDEVHRLPGLPRRRRPPPPELGESPIEKSPSCPAGGVSPAARPAGRPWPTWIRTDQRPSPSP